MTENEKKGVCQCRFCNGVFNQSQIKRIHNEHLGQTVINSVCPHCDSTTWGLINPIVDEEYNTYKSRTIKNNSKLETMQKYEVNDDEELDFYIHGYLIK